MSWHRGPMALFDCESTGVDPHRDRIVTAAIVEVTPGADRPSRSSTWLLDPGIDIPAPAAAVHGVTTEHARDALLSGRIAWAICEATPGARIAADDLHDSLIDLAREQADSLGAWLVKQGKADDVAREWPWRPPPPGWTPEDMPLAREEIPA